MGVSAQRHAVKKAEEEVLRGSGPPLGSGWVRQRHTGGGTSTQL